MAGRFSLLVMLALMAGGCATANEERIARLETAVEGLQSQEVRLTLLEGVVNAVVAEQRAAREGKTGQERAAAPVSAKPAPAPVKPAAQTAPAPVSKNVPPAQARQTMAQAGKAYKTALATFESGRPAEAMPLFAAFLREHPGDALAPNAGYWLGECQYSLKQYDSAIIAFKDVVAQFPQHDKAAAAMLKARYSYAQLGDAANARFYLEALLRDFPSSAPASLARARLAAL